MVRAPVALCIIPFVLLLLLIPSVSVAQLEAPADELEDIDAIPDEDEPILVGDPPPEPEGPDGLRGPGVEEIIVTAQKREESLQEVPAAVSAFTGGQLDDAGITQVQDLAFDVPNLHFGQELGATRITIRGISTGSGSDQSTAFHIDGIYQNDSTVGAALTFYDIQRVDVLRGPQGTLYGRNATGGAVNVFTNQPNYDFEFFGDLQIGTFNQTLARGVMNVPLVDERVALRVSGFADRRYGYQKNELYNDPALDADDAKDAGLRAQLLVSPVDNIDVTLRFNYFRRNGIGYGIKRFGPFPAGGIVDLGIIQLPIYTGANPNPADPRRVNQNQPGRLMAESYNGNLDFRWYLEDVPLLGDAEWKVLGSYTNRDSFSLLDQDNSSLPTVFSEIDNPRTEWVAETQLTSQNDGDVDWVVGLFHLGTQDFQLVNAPSRVQVAVPPPPAPPLVAQLDVVQSISSRDYSFAAYANAGWQFADDWKLNAGFRYSYDWKRGLFIHEPACIPVPPGPVCIAIFPFVEENKRDDFGRPSGSLSVDWQFTDDNLAYAKFSTGYKAGTVEFSTLEVGNLDPIPRPNTVPEDIFAFEIGSKNDFWDNRVRLNATVFAYYYKDLQVSQIVQSVVQRENADSSRIFGAELELVTRPWRELTISGNLSYLNAKYITFNTCTRADRPGERFDCSGNYMNRAPEWSGTGVIEYTFDLNRYGQLTPRFQAFFSSKVFFRPTNDPEDIQGAYSLLDFRLLWRSQSGNYTIDMFVENALDKDVASTVFTGSFLIGAPQQQAFDRPRTAGIRFAVEY